jgi:hypothetical protein
VLANVRVLLVLVTTQPRRASDGTVESMLILARMGVAADRQGAAVDRPGAASDRHGATIDRTGAASVRLSASNDSQGVTADKMC